LEESELIVFVYINYVGQNVSFCKKDCVNNSKCSTKEQLCHKQTLYVIALQIKKSSVDS